MADAPRRAGHFSEKKQRPTRPGAPRRAGNSSKSMASGRTGQMDEEGEGRAEGAVAGAPRRAGHFFGDPKGWGAGSPRRRDDEVGPPQGPQGLGRERKNHKTVTPG